MKRLAIAALAAILVAGCSVPKAGIAADPNLTAAGVIVLRAGIRHGVEDYIRKHGAGQVLERATRAKALIDDVLVALDGDPEVSIGKLREFAFSKIPAELSPMDQQDARDLIDLVATSIGAYVGRGTLDPAAVVKLRDALGWISQAAALVVPPA